METVGKMHFEDNIRSGRNTDTSRESKAGDEMGDSIDPKDTMTLEEIEREQCSLFAGKIKWSNNEKNRFIFVLLFSFYIYCCAAIAVQWKE